jgi:redox-sensitive bicupin YhaK (pirin superfamily)
MKPAQPALVRGVRPLGHGPMDTPDPWLFCVYHKDHYPKGNARLEAPRPGDGQDFDPSAPYRMYHGERVPGFPQHPHRGFETITATMEGLVDHSDSLGNGGRYGDGDVQWMTAGSGVVHAEMFPLLNQQGDNPLRFFQLWLNLPRASKMSDPFFVMHWADEVPKLRADDGLSTITVFAGGMGDKAAALTPPPNSYAAREGSHVACWFVEMRPGGKVELPVAPADVNRRIYVVEGQSVLVSTSAGGKAVGGKMMADLDASQEVILSAEGDQDVHVLVLQGKPIGEPVVQHGPFVGNTRQDIMSAFSDYRETQFGGWPWPRDDYVFPADKGRFALVGGKEIHPAAKSR